MFTPQKLWSLTPKRGTLSGPNSGDGTASKGKSLAFLEAKTLASGSVRENGDNGLVGSGGAAMDREVLVERISSLEKELYDYQFNMGLLLIEKKEWNSKLNELSQELQEVRDALEQEKSAHLIAISEAEKREDNLRKALGVEKECVLDLEKSLREMRAEHAEIKFSADSKLAEANALVASIEEKSLEVEARLRAADAKHAEMNRKSLEMDRRLKDLEAQESALRRERLSFIAEKELHESTLSKQREDLREWEKKVQEGEERLAKSQRILNEREQRTNETDRILRQKEKELEDTHKNIEASNVALRSKEDDINSRLANINLKEKEYDAMRMKLDLKEKELSVWEQKLNDREKVEIQKLLEEHKATLDLKKQEFDVELDEKRKSFEAGLQDRMVELEKKEVEINHMEEKVAKREQALEKKTEKLREKEKEFELKLKGLKEREKSVKSQEKNLEKEKGQLECERERLLSMKTEAEKIRTDNEEELQRIHEETNRLKVTEEERSEYVRLQSELKQEIDQYRLQKELLLKEADDLRQQKEIFERDWDELDLKKANIDKELKAVTKQKEEISKLQQFEEEKLKNEKQATEEYLQRELEALKLAKESFAIQMEDEKSELAEKSQSERSQMLLDFELRKKELEADMQKQLEQKENNFLESKKLFEEERERELSNINYLREVAHREMEEMKLQRSKVEKEKQEAAENKMHMQRQRLEMREDIDVLVDLNSKLKNQREQFVEERQRFINFVEKLRSCLNCGEMVSEFVLSDLQSLAEIEKIEVPSLPKLTDDIMQGSPDVNLVSGQDTGVSPATVSKSPVSGGTISWLRKCTSKIFKISPGRKIESEDVHASREAVTLSVEEGRLEEPSGGIPGPENEEELSFAILSDSFGVQRTHPDNDLTQAEAEKDLSIDNQSNIDSKALEAPEDSQLSDSKGGQQKPRKRGRARIKRNYSVRAVVKDAKNILGEPLNDDETEYPNGTAEDSANVDNETRKPSRRRMPANARKRNHVQTSQMTESKNDDVNEGQSDSEVQGQPKRRRRKVAPPVREPRYNLRRPKAGTAATSSRALSGGGSKESEGEVDRVKETEDAIFHSKTSSLSMGVPNENGGNTLPVQSEKIVEIQDGSGETTRNAANNTALSEEVNGTPDDAGNHDAEYMSEESRGEDTADREEDEDIERPGEASIGKKLWNFFTT
ncbi:nuclear matrix constituent protein 1 [Prosopis cineraria]|uniref:nuclear matrix constituent protein 1 n=1 Tax=Prosopis cineraria TaxID=364024 RepID=UPI00240FF937|nr:nuclear matrix constituent protein 1 [Prosopis cineraria]